MRNISKHFFAVLFLAGTMVTPYQLTAQSTTAQTDSVFKPSGRLWGLAYGDFAYKYQSDPLNRGGLNQYTGVKKDLTLFQFRRIYLGYNYDISRKFSAEFLLASEENGSTTTTPFPIITGDLLTNNKMALFVKLANVRWKNIFRGADLVVGQVSTPAYPLLIEPLWDYRCIERTITDNRRTPSYDMGATIQGKIINKPSTELGYNLMVANGMAARPEIDPFKWFYGDIYTKLLDKKLILDLYADYSKIQWFNAWHHDRCMVKGFAGYTVPKFTIGVEVFFNSLMNDARDSTHTAKFDTMTTKALGISIFARGRIYKDLLGFFVRYDNLDPSLNNNASVTRYIPQTITYDPNTKEQFITAGIDYSPISKIHIMPNVWYNMYTNAGPFNYGADNNGSDIIFRLSLYYVYGK